MMQGKPQMNRMDFAPTQSGLLSPLPLHPEMTEMQQAIHNTQSVRQANMMAQHCDSRSADNAFQLLKVTGLLHR